MLELVVDPVLFAPPPSNGVNAWMDRLSRLSEFSARSCIRMTCAPIARDAAISLWYSNQLIGGAPSSHELARLAHERASRLHIGPEFDAASPLIDAVSVDPSYVAAQVALDGRKDFGTHLGEAACAKSEGVGHVGIFGPTASWARPTEAVEVETEVLARDDPLDGLIEVTEDIGVREFLPRYESFDRLLVACSDNPCGLLDAPEFGVRALWASHFGGDPWGIDFEIGPKFASSLLAMNYHHRPGEAKRCLRVMAQIAGGLDDQVDGHEERETAAPGSPVQKDPDGNPIIRSRLQNGVSDAHRIFWSRGSKPLFLNVSGHQGQPSI